MTIPSKSPRARRRALYAARTALMTPLLAVAQTAAPTVEVIGTARALPRIVPLVESPDPQVARQARDAVAAITKRTKGQKTHDLG